MGGAGRGSGQGVDMQREATATIEPESAAAPAGLRGATGLLLAASAVILVYAMAVAIPNVFTIDGLIYVAMAKAMAEHGSFAISNGFETYRSPSLDLLFLVPVGDRLVPQYPGGWAFLAAPFYMLGGLRGLFLLNALATIGTIWLIRDTSRELFASPRAATAAALIFAFATFAFDYAGAVWPHAVTVAGIAAATAAAARAWRRASPAWALAGGLALGIAVNFRVDAAFAAPAIGFWLLAASSRPWANAGAFAAGMLPGLLGSAVINQMKFGIFSPITYGRSGADGATSIGFYADLLPFAVAAAVPLLLLGSQRARRIAYHPGVLALLAAVAVAVALVPGIRPVVLRLLTGTAALVVDIQTFRDAFQSDLVTEMPDGTITLFGYPKKALLQSLPWLAGCLILAPGLLRGRDRAGLALLVLLPLALVLPFAWSAWFGGRGNHMRYMVNLFPALAILGGMALDRLASEPGRSRILGLYAAGAATAAGLGYGLLRARESLYILQNSLPNALAASLAVLVLAVVLGGALAVRPALVSAARGVFTAALAMAFVSAWGLDLAVHQARRAKLAGIAEAARTLPPDAVIQSVRAEAFFERVGQGAGIVAVVARGGELYDRDFIRRVLAEGRQVYVQQEGLARIMVDEGIAGSYEPAASLDSQDNLYRIAPP